MATNKSKKNKSRSQGKLATAKSKMTIKAKSSKGKAAKPGKKSVLKKAKKLTSIKASLKPKIENKAKTSGKIAISKAPKKTGGKWDNVFVPLDDRILVRVIAAAEKTAGGIIIPSSVEAKPNQGEVLSVGRGHRDNKGRLRPLDVQIGDSVLFTEFAGAKTNILGEELLILREGDVLGVLA